MATTGVPGSAGVHGRLWGTRARDWADLQEGHHRPDYEAVMARLRVGDGMSLCDLGCASGIAAEVAARRGARVAGLDAAEPLIAIARTRVPSGDFRVGEMEELPFPDATFDVVTGFCSFNYAARPYVALAEARRIAKPGGSVVMTTWGNPDATGMGTLIHALTPLLPPRPPGAMPIFALSDEHALRAVVQSAGLTPRDVEVVGHEWFYPDLATAVRAFASSGRAVRAIETSGEAAVNELHASALAPFRGDDGAYRIDGATIRLVASA